GLHRIHFPPHLFRSGIDICENDSGGLQSNVPACQLAHELRGIKDLENLRSEARQAVEDRDEIRIGTVGTDELMATRKLLKRNLARSVVRDVGHGARVQALRLASLLVGELE